MQTKSLLVAFCLSIVLCGARRVDAIVFNEIMFHDDTLDDRPTEWIEIFNERVDPFDLSGYNFCNGVSYTFPPGTWLDGNSYIIVSADLAAFVAKYDTAGMLVVGPWTGSLANNGERIELCNPAGLAVLECDYNDRGKWPVAADGTGHSLSLVTPYSDPDDADNWLHSLDRGGTPGDPNGHASQAADREVPVVINEAHFNSGDDRWIELYNRTGSTVDLSGYSLTDDPSDLTKSTLPGGTTIASGGFLVLSETDLGLDFMLTEQRNRVFVALVDGTGEVVVDAFNFETHHPGFSEARVPDGDREFDDGADPTPGAANTIGANQDVVINEVLYHALDNDRNKEFIELFNRGDQGVDMTGWSLTRGVDFLFPDGLVIPSGGFLVVARNPDYIIDTYGLDSGMVLGPAQDEESLDDFGSLRDSGERVTLKDEMERTVDTFSYDDGGEWPRWADGHGSSLELIDATQDNRFAMAWDASDDSDKAEVSEFNYIGQHGGGESELHVLLLSRGIAIVDDLSVIGGGVLHDDSPFIERTSSWKYLKGTQAPPAGWNERVFNDGSWSEGTTSIGYGDGDDTTVLSDMRNNYMTVYFRRSFNVVDPAAIDELILNVLIDDGFIAYLNGTQVASQNVTGNNFDDPAGSAVGDWEEIERNISSFKNALVVGTNVLAVEVHNAGLNSSDLTFNPSLIDRTTTFVEGSEQVVNPGFDSNTSGWTIQGTHTRSGRTSVDPISGAGSLKIVATGRGDNKVNRIETSNSGIGDLSTNEDLQISLKTRWVIGSPTILTHGYQHAMAKSHRMMIPDDLGTPGAVNSVTLRQNARNGGNLGPVFRGYSQDPAVPGGSQAVTVRVRVADSDGVQPGSVRIRHSTGNPSASPASITMSSVGGGWYEGTIPGRSSGTRVVFYITATDAAGVSGRYPRDVIETTHPLLLNSDSNSLNDKHYFIYKHDTRNPATRFHNYRFWTTDYHYGVLSSRRNLSNDLIPGAFLFGGDTIYQGANARFSGSPFARGSWGSFRIALPRGNPLHGSIRKFNIDTHHGNGADARERISHYLIRQTNVGSTRVPYSDLQVMVRWQMNDRQMGTREHGWVPDTQFLSFWFPDDDNGAFFEVDDRFVINDGGGRDGNTNARVLYPTPSPRGDGNGENKENYRWFFGLRRDNGADDFSELIELAAFMDPGNTSDAVFDQNVFDRLNVEEMLRIWAVRMNTDDWDSWGTNRGKNCYLYRPANDGRWNLMAWDMELTYGNDGSFMIPSSPSSPFRPGGFAEVRRMVSRPQIQRMYYAILDEMVNDGGWFGSTFLTPFMNRLSQIGMARTEIGRAGGFIDARANRLRSAIQSVVYPQTRMRITTNSGNDFSVDELSVSLSGTAPVEISSIIVSNNGEVGPGYPIRSTSITNWSLSDIAILPGTNELTLFGFNFSGELIDSESITITSTVEAGPAPFLASVDPGTALPGESVTVSGSDFVAGIRVFFGSSESPSVEVNGSTSMTVEVPESTGAVTLTARNIGSDDSNALQFIYPVSFVRGDANGDLAVDLSDAVKTLLFLFNGGSMECREAGDANDSGDINITDPVYVLNFLFLTGPAMPQPYPDPGFDLDGDGLSCDG